MKLCQHCEKRPANRARGLCSTCHAILAVREQYPLCDNYPGIHALDDLTEEELDEIIAEQMQCLPKWWDRSGDNMRRRQK